ncbi:MAG: nucleoside triphosphate pyrophosphohydrolase [Chloroflexi bacterium]|nr:nucleoside triphosphate pyrophosphohydrolase [Chloroflexota bacterium]MCA2001240.1 nucleoside triphosphate pyrophosphohydrolase [Chloroflexota bacterium]
MDFAPLSSVFETLRLTPPPRLTLLDAQILASAHYPPFPPDAPALLMGLASPELALRVKNVLSVIYPQRHELIIVEGRNSRVISLDNLQPSIFDFSPSVCLYVPSLGEGTSFEAFGEIVAHLRAPDGCPWDKKQTHQSLRPHLLEESYEALAAMDENDTDGMREEFGDLLLQIMLNVQIAAENGEFTMAQAVKGIYDKIIRRHPHVFGGVELNTVDGVLQNWERLKEQERKENGKAQLEKGLLDGVPSALPALTQAQEYQERAARVGFDWPETEGVLDKVREEIEEVKAAQSLEEVAAELGDLFFVLVNLARWRKVDAESALRTANMKFKKRFAHIERGAKKQGRSLSDMTLAEMDSLWNEAKRLGL